VAVGDVSEAGLEKASRPATVRRAIADHLSSGQVTRVVYGAIIGLALVVVLQKHPPAAGVVAGSLVSTAIAVGLAELYSGIVGAETRTRRRVSRGHLGELAEDAIAVGFGISFPAVFFVLAAAGVMSLDSAFGVARWSGLGLIGFYGYAAARLAGNRRLVCVLQATAVAGIGVLVIALKALIH
jgi:hypothetical protein